ncbi:MAG: HDOD domain-containing protein [Gammaproteobacteria bacterium]|nr:HDOD domain-containing protein [Gammaproteobacteria bacterium]
MTSDENQIEIVQRLLQLGDLKSLGNIALLEIAKTAQLIALAKGKSLLADEQLSYHLYLISGEIELGANGKIMQTFDAGSERARLPLFRVHTHGLTAKALSPVRLLSLDESIVNRYVATIKPREGSGITVEDYHEGEQEASIIGEIRHIFHHNEVDLPSLPEIALRINRAINNPKLTIQNLVTEIQADPLIAARVVQVANSALYANTTRVDNLQTAVSRIGIRIVQTIVMSVVLRNLFKPKSPLIHKRALKYYAHSIRVGAISFVLARHLRGFNQDEAFLSGLLHDIGTVPLLIMADGRADLSENPQLLEAVIHNLTGMAGGILLRQWGFSPALQTVATEAQEWQRQRETADYCDLVQVAQLHCHLVGGQKQDAPPMNELPAFKRLSLESVDPVGLIHEAREEIQEVVSALTH